MYIVVPTAQCENKVSNVGDIDQRLPFQMLPHRGIGEGAIPSPGLLHFTLDTYLITLC